MKGSFDLLVATVVGSVVVVACVVTSAARKGHVKS